MNIDNFQDAHNELKRFIPLSLGRGAYTLDRMQALMQALGNPQDNYKVIHVAGTSGKTSTCYYISSLLQQAGKKVGLTVSPHVDGINERVQVDLTPLPEDKFCKQLEKFIKLVDQTNIKPTYFELLVAFAYWQFADDKVDYAVIEVGLGGLLDGTNVVTRSDKVCVITDIGLDHTEILGKTLPEIASQKAGIIRPHTTVFMYEQDEEVMDVVREVCEAHSADLHEIWPVKAGDLPKNLPLFQRRNWYLAQNVYNFLVERDGLTEMDEAHLSASTSVQVPARMEVIEYKDKLIIMDGAHNAQKLQTLFKSIRAKYPKQDMAVLLSLKHTKGVRTQTSLDVLVKYATWLGFTSFTGEQDTPYRSVDTSKMAERCHMMGFEDWEIIDDPEEGLKELLERPEAILLVTGSFYLLNHIRPAIRKLTK